MNKTVKSAAKRKKKAVKIRPLGSRISRPSLIPLEKNQYRTKLYGLHALREISRKSGIKFLDFLVFKNASSFSLKRFSNVQGGRLIVRTDPSRRTYTQTMKEWVSMPRLNFYLERQSPAKSESFIKKWMREIRKKKPRLIFIMHKVRNLKDYKQVVQLNVDLSMGQITISATEAATDRFREEPTKSESLIIDDKGRIRRPIGSKIILPETLQAKTIAALKSLIGYANKTGHSVFEASYVTYNEAPDAPEFYDLVFGKQM